MSLADGSDHICEKPLIFCLSNDGLWVSLLGEDIDDDPEWPKLSRSSGSLAFASYWPD